LESREMPVYALVPAPGGLKLPPPQDGSCVEGDAPPPTHGRIVEQHPGYTVYESTPRCGDMETRPEAGGWYWVGGKVPMAHFVRTVTGALGRTVIDQTGFSGVFDINLEFRR